jgi:hypothetical protein
LHAQQVNTVTQEYGLHALMNESCAMLRSAHAAL